MNMRKTKVKFLKEFWFRMWQISFMPYSLIPYNLHEKHPDFILPWWNLQEPAVTYCLNKAGEYHDVYNKLRIERMQNRNEIH